MHMKLAKSLGLLSGVLLVLAGPQAAGAKEPIPDAHLARFVGRVCPHCDDCQEINDTFRECLHRGEADPCDTTRCIENIMTTAACRLVNTEGPDHCDTRPVVPAASAIRQIGRTHRCRSNVGWHTWRTRWIGCTTCTSIRTRVRCDHATCAGDPFEPDSFVGVRHRCGC